MNAREVKVATSPIVLALWSSAARMATTEGGILLRGFGSILNVQESSLCPLRRMCEPKLEWGLSTPYTALLSSWYTTLVAGADLDSKAHRK
jgi:hypothetical protein